MSMASIETSILYELRRITGVNSLRKKDMMEWSTGSLEPQKGEVCFNLPENQVNVCIKKELIK